MGATCVPAASEQSGMPAPIRSASAAWPLGHGCAAAVLLHASIRDLRAGMQHQLGESRSSQLLRLGLSGTDAARGVHPVPHPRLRQAQPVAPGGHIAVLRASRRPHGVQLRRAPGHGADPDALGAHRKCHRNGSRVRNSRSSSDAPPKGAKHFYDLSDPGDPRRSPMRHRPNAIPTRPPADRDPHRAVTPGPPSARGAWSHEHRAPCAGCQLRASPTNRGRPVPSSLPEP